MREEIVEIVRQLQQAVEACLPPALQGKIEYGVESNRFVLKSKDRSLLDAFKDSLDLEPVQMGDKYCSTRVISVSRASRVFNYLRENQSLLLTTVCEKYIELEKLKLEKKWRVHADRYTQYEIFSEILKEISTSSSIQELRIFTELLNSFTSKLFTENFDSAVQALERGFLAKWAAVANYYFQQFCFNADDCAGHRGAHFQESPWYWITMFQYIIEPAIQKSQVARVSLEVTALAEPLMKLGLENSILFTQINEALDADELNIAKLNELVMRHGVAAEQHLAGIYRALGVYDLKRGRVVDIESLPEPNRYERRLSDGRRLALAPLRAANASYLFQIPANPRPQGYLNPDAPSSDSESFSLGKQ